MGRTVPAACGKHSLLGLLPGHRNRGALWSSPQGSEGDQCPACRVPCPTCVEVTRDWKLPGLARTVPAGHGRGPAGARPPDEKLTLKTLTGDRGHSSISPGSCLSIRVWSPSQRLEVGVRTSARSPPPYPPLAAPVIGNCLFLGLFSVSLASMEWQLLDSRVQESRGGNGGSNTHPCPGGQLHSLHCSSGLSSREALQLVAL